MGKMYDVEVKANRREKFNSYWSAQREFVAGVPQKLQVDARELRELLDDEARGSLTIEGSASLREELKNDPEAGAASTTQVALTGEEQAAVEAFRRQKAAGQATVQVPVQTTPQPADQNKGKGK